jgi:RNA-directed DNA polymerase
MLEPRDKLDVTAVLDAITVADGGEVVNGPEGTPVDWQSIDWRRVEGDVKRLRQRIFAASKAGDLAKVRNLQKLMLRSRANALLSVRRVTEVNAGRLTAGVDGKVVLEPQDKADLAGWAHQCPRSWIPQPVRRVYIPKSNGKRRPLGIPVIADRVLQAQTVSALEPEWEARFESKSYGFRPGRGCHDAIEAIFLTAKGVNAKRLWVLDADLAAAFDRIDHNHLLACLGSFPAKGLIRQWLRSGVIDKGWFAPTEDGVPQGGVISPLLLNVALHGMEQAAGVRYCTTGRHAGSVLANSPILVRYADDMVVFAHSRDEAEQVKNRLAAWLAPRGLKFNEEKTQIVSLSQGFDFLGFNVRRYGAKLLIKPSKAALRRVRERLTVEMRTLRGTNAEAVVATLNPVIKGWAAYYRTGVSSGAFAALDNHMWHLTYKWSRHSHPNKSRQWVTTRYFGSFNRSRRDVWVFGDRDSGAYLHKFSWTKIVRHHMVKGAASPDDPALVVYWTERRRRKTNPLDMAGLPVLQVQRGRCPLCGGLLLHADYEPQSPREWELWLKVIRVAIRRQVIAVTGELGASDKPAALRLIHAHCRSRLQWDTGNEPTLLTARDPSGLA